MIFLNQLTEPYQLIGKTVKVCKLDESKDNLIITFTDDSYAVMHNSNEDIMRGEDLTLGEFLKWDLVPICGRAQNA